MDEHIVREWSYLVNPQTRIPEFIERLTGISNAMVQDALPFEERADTICWAARKQAVYAHNARFYHSFLNLPQPTCQRFDTIDMNF